MEHFARAIRARARVERRIQRRGSVQNEEKQGFESRTYVSCVASEVAPLDLVRDNKRVAGEIEALVNAVSIVLVEAGRQERVGAT